MAGAAGSSDPGGAFLYRDFDDSLVKGESALDKAAFSWTFHEVVTLITGFFPCTKLSSSSSSSSEESIPREDICGPSSSRGPRNFLMLFDKMCSLSKQVSEKFQKTANEKKKTSSALPR